MFSVNSYAFKILWGSFAKELVIAILNFFNVPVLQKEFIMSKQFDLSMRKIVEWKMQSISTNSNLET